MVRITIVSINGAVGEELEGTAGGGFIDAADLGDGGDGDGFDGVAEGGDDALFLRGEAGEEVAEDELAGIIAKRVNEQVLSWRVICRTAHPIHRLLEGDAIFTH